MARIKVVAIKHFIGCVNFDEVKSRYKKLAMQFHPDRPSGSHALFIELQAELDYIKEYSPVYPLGKSDPLEDLLRNGFGFGSGVDAFAEAARRAQREQQQARAAAENLARRQREARERQRAYQQGPSSNRADDPYWGEPFWGKDTEEAKWKRVLFDKHPRADVFRVIKGVADEALATNKSGNWMLMEVYKLDDLDMEHFKFLKWYLLKVSPTHKSLNEGWVGQTYKNYVAVKNINWEVE